MNIIEYIPGKKCVSSGTAVALGLFDGVHKGHRYLLGEAKRLARKMGLVFTVFTFRAEGGLFKNSPPLYSTEDKLALLRDIGVDAVVLAKFEDVCAISAEDFISGSLIRDMSCRAAIFGEDFRFGSKAAGDARLLCDTLAERGLSALVVDEQTEGGEKISTTRIKRLLSKGEVRTAAALLKIPYFIKSRVSHGVGLAKKLGFPTVNTSLSENALEIKHGVYTSAVLIDGKFHTGITNIGICPTFDARAPHAETYILNYGENLYGREITIYLLDYIREERKFNTADDLISQVKKDEEKALKDWNLLWQEIGLS